MAASNVSQKILSLHPAPYASSKSELFSLKDSLTKESFISSEMEKTLNQINVLNYSGLIPSKVAISLKNNLTDPLTSESILSEFIIDLIANEQLIPEAKQIVKERGFSKTILYLYTCHLQQLSSKLETSIVQQQVWKHEFQDLFERMLEEEEMNNKAYIKEWLQTINLDKEEQNFFVAPLLKPLTDCQFKEHFLTLLQHLQSKEKSTVHKFCLEELYTMLEKESDGDVLLLTAQILKGLQFYQRHVGKIEEISQEILTLNPAEKKTLIDTCLKAHQFSILIGADAIKNAPRARDLETTYSLIAGRIKTEWEEIQSTIQNNTLKKMSLIARGGSKDEEIASQNIEEVLETIKKPFQALCIPTELFPANTQTQNILGFLNAESLCKKHHAFRIVNLFAKETEEDSEKNTKKLVQYLLKKTPSSLIAPLSHNHKHLLLEAAKSLGIPITFVAINTDLDAWEEISYSDYPHFTIAFPTPMDPNIPEEINKEKTTISGLPVIQRSFRNAEDLKQKWGLPADKKIILVNTPEGDLTWPKFLAKNYSEDENILLIVLTDNQNKKFLHTLKTEISTETTLPIQTYTSLTPKEKEEFLLMAHLVIDKNKQGDSAILLESNKAGTRLLIDNTSPPLFSRGLSGFALSCLNSFLGLFDIKNELPETILHEKFLETQNLGRMIRSEKEFRQAFEELLIEETPVSISPENFRETFPQILETMDKTSPKDTLLKKPLNLFTS